MNDTNGFVADRRKDAISAALACLLLFCQGGAIAADAKVTSPAAHAAESTVKSGAAVRRLLDKDQIGAAGKELLMLTVEYPPGGSSGPHRHNAQVFVYVLEGSVIMQVAGSPAVTLHPGDTFYEGPTDVHTVSANASKTEPAKILVFIAKDKNAPVTLPAGAKGGS
jgi:quercetin dioxygenase-like cupin family protein